MYVHEQASENINKRTINKTSFEDVFMATMCELWEAKKNLHTLPKADIGYETEYIECLEGMVEIFGSARNQSRLSAAK